ncbi:N-acetylmuramidase domain-containing protein [Paraburkholderia sp. WSM4175]|uniref:N-acetylmuramidase domain-containing protein n=1 Tax=Paraburkholderia sp. WSM4175 TaxID=2991072 RepID=UPI003D1A8E46
MLYERHKFSKHSNHRFDAANADISSEKHYTRKKLDKAGHPIAPNDRYGADQYERFERAYLLDADAAIQACSWGKFQVLEENWKDLRFQTIQQFLEAACTSERRHLLDLFIPFALSKSDPKHGNGTLRNALIEKNWVNAAWLYNGPGYSENNYDDQLKKAYEKIKTGALRV